MSENNHAETIRDLTAAEILAHQAPSILVAEDGREFLIKPDGDGSWGHLDITPTNKIEPLPPKIVTQAVQLQQVESLIAYVNRFKNAESLLFADISTDIILAVIDYHAQPAMNRGRPPVEEGTPPTAEGDDKPTAAFNKHTATLRLPRSLEWQTWTAIDGKLMSHVDFADFLEENAIDILPLGQLTDSNDNVIEDAPSTLFEIVRELQVKSSFGATSAIRNGDYVSVEMQKGDDVTTKKNVALPISIDINIPVYFGEQPALVRVLIKRKVVEGSLRLGFKLIRPEQVRQDEFKRIVGEIEQDVNLATHYGKPA